MANATGTVRAGRAYVEIMLDDSKLEKGLRNAKARILAFGSSLTSLGKNMIAAAAAMAAPMAIAARTFSSFDDEMRMAKAVTGATREEFESLTAVAERLGRTTSFTAREVASGMVAMGRMGFNPREIEDAIGAVLDLARATGTELSEAAEIAANNMRVFSIDTSKMAGVADVLTAAANGSAQTLADLSEGLKMAGPQAAAANDTLVNVAAALGVLANMGIRGSLAGTALRKSYSQFAKVNIREQLRGIGVETADANGNLREMPAIMADIARSMNTMPTAERLAFAESIFDLRGSLAGLQLGGNIAQLDAFIAKLKNVEDVSAATAKEMDSGIGSATRILLSALEGCQIALGRIVSEAMMPYIVSMTEALESTAKWIAEHKEFVIMAMQATAAIAATGAAMIAIGLAAKTAAIMVGGLAAVFKLLKIAIMAPMAIAQGLDKAFSLLKTAMIAVRGAAVTAWAAIASPAGLAGAALAAVVAVVWKLTGAWDMCRNAASGLAEGVGAAFSSIGNIARETFSAIKDAILSGNLAGACKVALTGMKAAWLTGLFPLSEAWYGFVEGLQDVWTMFKFGVLKAANDVWFGLRTGMQETGMWISDAWDSIWNGILALFDTVVASLKKDWLLLQKAFDWSIDLDAGFAEIDSEAAASRSQRIADSREKQAENAKAREDLSKEWTQSSADISSNRDAEYMANYNRRQDKTNAARKAIDDAMAEWNAAIEDVREKAAKKTENVTEKTARKTEAAETGARYAEAAVERDTNPGKAFGSWSASELASLLGGGTAEDRMAKNSEELVKLSGESRDYLRKIQTNGMKLKYT